jgi:hypothetical protein
MKICMIKLFGLLAAVFFWYSSCSAYEIPSSILASYKQIVDILKANDATKLATLIAYPLRRENPLPNIKNAKEFIAYYPILCDEAFRKKLEKYSDNYVVEHHGSYGLVGDAFSGDIWLNEEGKITAINYLSAEESRLKEACAAKIQSRVHPSVREWKENVRVGKSNNLTIRVDRTEKGLRYVSWSKGHSMAEKPDLILFNGVEEAQGTMGGWTWTFKNGNWTYVVDDVKQCETEDLCGLFLRLYFNNAEKNTIRLREIK